MPPAQAAAAGVRAAADPAGGAQAEYDAARELVERLERSLPVGRGCSGAYEAASAYAAALVKEAEGIDRLRPGLTRSARSASARALARLDRASRACETAGGPAVAHAPTPTNPAPHEATFGRALVFEGPAPRVATEAVVGIDRRPDCARGGVRLVGGRLFTRVAAPTGRHLVQLAFCARRSGRSVLVARTAPQPAWLLPPAAAQAAPPRSADGALSAGLAGIPFDGDSAVWFHDLTTGRTAAANADTRFPAASTVKLALLVAALQRHGAHSPLAYDLAAMATWSSNLATNRLLARVGGAAVAQRTLARLGATRSTFTGGYRVATAARGSGPPAISTRVTTARDLGRVLYLLHAGAAGRRGALATLRLRRQEAQLALGLLLDSEPVGDNVGLLRPALPASTPLAQKHGWFSAVRHTAAIVYAPSGPRILVVLTYRDGLTLAAAQSYARSVATRLLD